MKFLLVSLLLLPAPAMAEPNLVVSRSAYAEKLEGFWLGQCIANWTGLVTEMDKIGDAGEYRTGAFYTRDDWGKPDLPSIWSDKPSELSPVIGFVFRGEDEIWGADDDTDIEYMYQHLLDTNEVSILTAEQIRDGWLKHIRKEEENFLWVSNERAFNLMQEGVLPPHTSDPAINAEYAMIDAQLTTEIFGLFAPGRPDVAKRMAHLPIRTTAREDAAWISEFYVTMHALAAFHEKGRPVGEHLAWSASKARKGLPDTSYAAAMYDFVRKQYQSGVPWEEARDELHERYQVRHEDGYDMSHKIGNGCFAGGINFGASLVSLFYGEGDLKETIKIGTLAGWDSDNPTATWGGLIGFLIGKSGVEESFGRTFSDRYNIHRTRQGFPRPVDTFSHMAQRGIGIIDRVVEEEMQGTVDPDGDLWKIPAKPTGMSMQTIVFPAPSVAPREMRFTILLPEGYEDSDKSYPVLYLLHGYGGNHIQWIEFGVEEAAIGHDLIVVMPDAANAEYVNWAVPGDGFKDNWEDYIVQDLISYVDAHYRTHACREGRAIGGLSMGGDGAMTIGLRHPEMFCSIASHSGSHGFKNEIRERLKKDEPALIYERESWISDFDIPGFGTFEERSASGEIVTSLEGLDAIDELKLIQKVPTEQIPDIYICCGTEDDFYERFIAFTKLMRDRKITHTTRVSPGGHDDAYWSTSIHFSLPHQYQIMQSQLAAVAESEEGAPPNIIYILTDDLGYGDLSCYGQEKFQTPHIDKLATEGIKFTQHYSGSTVCAPARCSLMTGLHTGHAQVRGNSPVWPEGQEPMAAGTVTIPSLLKSAGYTTGMFGKWGLGAPGSASDPMVFFDEFYGYNCQRLAHSYYPEYLWHNNEKVPLDGKTHSHDLIMNAALEFIQSNKEKPFFCYLPVTIPHAAMHAPKELHEKYRKLYPQFESKTGKYAKTEVQNPIAAFPAMMEALDNGVGEIMALLEDLGIDDNTLVIFTSDNGPHSEGGHDPGYWDSNGPLRGLKRDLYEGGIRVPFLARWPANIRAGSTSDHVSAFWDMMPTFCELAGIETPTQTDGVSMLPALTGGQQKPHDYLYWEFTERGGSQAIRQGNFKAVRLNVSRDPSAKIELYDLASDPAEANDIASDHPEIVQQMASLFAEARTESGTFKLFKPGQ
ncbi:sulfatase-like hydrolase/transferase [Puniceicoccales bacterium CK1056]|uniref:Sulfatase-like hydrolase/transferase n=1 Tax=Oceanipulchritudo coccoides TaxID=2706888 RepID=A0A6B2LZS6_9BACT|nr:sulfatase-like hydrolase/transferase [Oceanipulchritudo coccoides]NDV61953.1 sulfatase-like hydrolase/transferase [Oceanipulchritudo coccoides]